jgi:hypothetical protein
VRVHFVEGTSLLLLDANLPPEEARAMFAETEAAVAKVKAGV